MVRKNTKSSFQNKDETIVVVGLGYVGLPLALLAAEKGYKVVGIDINESKVRLISQHKAPFRDKIVEEQLKTSTLEVSHSFERIKDAKTIIICVPTPIYPNHMPNLEPVVSACQHIAPFLQKGQLVVLESTVNPGVCETIMLPILERFSGLKAGRDFSLAHCPERINPGDENWKVRNIPRVVGGFDKESLEKALEFYHSIIEAEIRPMSSLKSAEAVKITENSFRDINIAFVNELAMSFSRLGIDVVDVIKGASTKPFSFLPHFPGCGVGGHCIPVDPYYLIEYAKTQGFEHDFLSLARRINNQMPRFTAELTMRGLGEAGIPIYGANVSVLGLSYKADIDDDRESPSYEIIKHLKEYGANVVAYDPYVPEKSTAGDLESALQGKHAVVLATAHSQFMDLDPRSFAEGGVKVLVDGRNCLPKEEFMKAGLIYKGIGR